MSDVRTGFARTDDGIHLYWRTVGTGPPMVCCNGVGVSTFFFKYITEHYRDRFQVVLWDYRGHGRSGLPADIERADLSIERNASDLQCVLDHLGIQQPAVLLGHSMGCQVILEYSKQFPQHTRAIIPMFGTFGRPLDTFMDNPNSLKMFKVIKRLAALGGRNSIRMILPLYANPLAFKLGGLTGMVDRHYAQKHDIDKYLEHLVHMDARVFLRMVDLMADHDLEQHLPELRVPMLIIAGEKDLFTPLHRSYRMQELVPDAELMVLAEASHAAIVEHPNTINQRIDRFLEQRLSKDDAPPAC